MTSSFQENVKMQLLYQAVTRYSMMYLGNSPKTRLGFKSILLVYIKNSDIENLRTLHLCHKLS